MPIIKSMRFLLHLIILINCISCFRREIDFSVVIVSSVDSIQFEDSNQAIDGEDAPVFTFHHLIEGREYEIHRDNKCSSALSNFTAQKVDGQFKHEIPEENLEEAQATNFYLKGRGTSGETFCINLQKEFTYSRKDSWDNISFSLGENVSPTDNKPEISVNILGLYPDRRVDLFSDNRCESSLTSNLSDVSKTSTKSTNGLSFTLNFSRYGEHQIYAKILNTRTNESLCSNNPLVYFFDNRPPQINAFTFNDDSEERSSFSTESTVNLKGSFSSGDKVTIYEGQSCETELKQEQISAVSVSELNLNIDLSISDGETKYLTYIAEDSLGNRTDCSDALSFKKLSDTKPSLGEVSNKSGDLAFNFSELVTAANLTYKANLFSASSTCTGTPTTVSIGTNKQAYFEDVFTVPNVYSSFSIQLILEGSSEQTTCFSSYEFTLLPSNSVSLTLPTSSSAGRDLDFTISGIESAGRVELFQNSNCSGAVWGAAVNVDGSASSITIDNKSIETPGNYQFSARLVTSDGVDTGCSNPFAHEVLPVQILWTNNSVIPGFGAESAEASVVWDFINGDEIKIYTSSLCAGAVTKTVSVSAISSSETIDLVDSLNNGVDTTFYFKINDRACEAVSITYNLLEPSLSLPGGSSGTSRTPDVKINFLPENRTMDLSLYNNDSCAGGADYVEEGKVLAGSNSYTFESTGRTAISQIGIQEYSVKVKLFNATGSEFVETCLGSIDYSLYPTAPTVLSVTESLDAPNKLVFTNNEQGLASVLLIYEGENCDQLLVSGTFGSLSPNPLEPGTYKFSAKKSKFSEGVNYVSECSGELASYTISYNGPSDVDSFSVTTGYSLTQNYGEVDLRVSVVASDFQNGEKLSLFTDSTCSGAAVTLDDSGTPRQEITVSTPVTGNTIDLVFNPGNYNVGLGTLYLQREDAGGTKNCHSGSPVNFEVTPTVGFNEATTSNPGLGNIADTVGSVNVDVTVGYQTLNDIDLQIFKGSGCVGGTMVHSVTLQNGTTTENIALRSYVNSVGNTTFSFKLVGASCFSTELTYKLLDLDLSLPGGTTGNDAKPDILVSGDISSIRDIYLLNNATCSGAFDVAYYSNDLIGNDSVTFGDTGDRDALSGDGLYYFSILVYLKTLDGNSVGGGKCLGPLSYNFDNTPPAVFSSFSASSGSSSHTFENNINFNLDLSASNLEDGEVIDLFMNSSCTDPAITSKTVTSDDVSKGVVDFMLDQSHFTGVSFSFNVDNNRTFEQKIYVKRTDILGNSACFSNEGAGEVLSLFVHETPTTSIKFQNTTISAPTDENNLRFMHSRLPAWVNQSSNTGYLKDVHVYKDPQCELSYVKKYQINQSLGDGFSDIFPELLNRTGIHQFYHRLKYIGTGSLSGQEFISGCIPAPSIEIIPTEVTSGGLLQSLLDSAVTNNSASYKKHFKLMNDIDLTQNDGSCSSINIPASNNWTPISEFDGTIDGDGYTLCGLYVLGNVANLGMFEMLGENSLIYNLVLKGTTIINNSSNSDSAAGTLAGEGKGVIERVSLQNFVGANSLNSSVRGNYNVGGLVGKSKGARIKKVESYIDVTCIENTVGSICDGHGVNFGGLVGSIENSAVMNTTFFDSTDYIEDFYRPGVVLNSSVHAYIKGRSAVGGIVGKSYGMVMYSYSANKNANGPTVGLGIVGDEKVGGIVGESKKTVEYDYSVWFSSSVANVTGNTGSAGIIGSSDSSHVPVYKSFYLTSNDYCYNKKTSSSYVSESACHNANPLKNFDSIADFEAKFAAECNSTYFMDCDGTFEIIANSLPKLRMNGVDGDPLGRGTREDPIIVKDKGDWDLIADTSKYRSLHIKLDPQDPGGNPLQSIDFSDPLDPPDSIEETFNRGLSSNELYEYFTGSFDGNYKTMTNLRQHSNNRYIGGIVNRSAGVVRNLKIADSLFTCGQGANLTDPSDDTINNQDDCSIFSKYSNGAVYENIVLENTEFRVTKGPTGLFSAHSYYSYFRNILIRGSSMISTTTSGNYMGGVIGKGGTAYLGLISNEQFTMNHVTNYSGGIVGYIFGTDDNRSYIEESMVDLDMTINPESCNRYLIGGIAGYSHTGVNLNNVYSTGSIRQETLSLCANPDPDDQIVNYIGGIFGGSRHSFIRNSYSDLNINAEPGPDGNSFPGLNDSTDCAGATGFVDGPDFKVHNSFFLGKVFCNQRSYGIARSQTRLSIGSDIKENNYWFNASDDATDCYDPGPGFECLTSGSPYVWTSSINAMEFIDGSSNPSLFDTFEVGTPSSGGLGWDQSVWSQSGDELPVLIKFRP